MLTFIIPLRSPQSSGDWRRVSALCNRTLSSIFNQSLADWQTILVCNERPIGCPDHPRLLVLEDDFAIPATHAEMMKDKGAKKRKGLGVVYDRLRNEIDRPIYAMLVDADDLVHRDLVPFVRGSKPCHGWMVDTGYFYFEHEWPFLVNVPGNFDQTCGTSIIMRLDEHVPRSADMAGHPLMGPHNEIAAHCRNIGKPLDIVPFRAVIQCRATNENVLSADFKYEGIRPMLGLLRRSRIMTKRIRQNFMLG